MGEQKGAGGSTKGKNIKATLAHGGKRDGPTWRYVSLWVPEIRCSQANVWTAEGRV